MVTLHIYNNKDKSNTFHNNKTLSQYEEDCVPLELS